VTLVMKGMDLCAQVSLAFRLILLLLYLFSHIPVG
jgi:hypothetical protein